MKIPALGEVHALLEAAQRLKSALKHGIIAAMRDGSYAGSLHQHSELASTLSRRGLERLDLLLLTIESLDLNGGEAMLRSAQQLGLQKLFPNGHDVQTELCGKLWVPLKVSWVLGGTNGIKLFEADGKEPL